MFSFIIPVFNRPDEIRELLQSVELLHRASDFEVIVIEDGSSNDCRSVITEFEDKFDIRYFFKSNSGPGDSRNFGMKEAKGDYFLIFDSDCIIPPHYLKEVVSELNSAYVDFFGGPDKALDTFSDIQKAINFAMTSFLTTGGVRGGSEASGKFQPRSFNMGISKNAFLASGGFGNIHPGEDPDLAIRLWKAGFSSRLFQNAFVYHKRRIDWQKFSLQVNKFGKARPILDSWHPEYAKFTYFFPSVFLLGLIISVICFLAGYVFPAVLYLFYFLIVFTDALIKTGSLRISIFAIIAVWKQFAGYGVGFAKSFLQIRVLKKAPSTVFPELFFKHG